jgi:hypothetical protein
LKRFLAVIKTRSDLGRHILTLIVTEATQWPPREDLPSALDAIGAILPKKLPNVRSLDISFRSFQPKDVQPAKGWASISRLQLRFCRFTSSDGMVAFIASFPRLESLDVFQCYASDAVPVAQRPSAVPMPAWHLKYLALGEFPRNGLIEWMVATPAAFAVDHLRILSLGPDATSFNALLDKIGDGLQHLELPRMYQRARGRAPGPGTYSPIPPFMYIVDRLTHVQRCSSRSANVRSSCG